MEKKATAKKDEKTEYIPISDPFAIEIVEVVKDFGNLKKGDKTEGHPNTMAILKNKGLVK